MKKIMIITGDVNDGDYVTSETIIGGKDFLSLSNEEFEKVKLIYSVLRNSDGWTENTNLYLLHKEEFVSKSITEDDLEMFEDRLPCGENGCGIHRIESIRILTVTEEETL